MERRILGPQSSNMSISQSKRQAAIARCKAIAESGNYISALKELSDFLKIQQPRFIDESSISNRFCVSCTFEEFESEGQGTSKKFAKSDAARNLWFKLQSAGTLSQILQESNDTNRDPLSCPQPFALPTQPECMGDGVINVPKPVLSLKTESLSVNETSEHHKPALKKESFCDPKLVNYIGMLQEFCLKQSAECPQFDYIPLKGISTRYLMTCTFQGKKVEVKRENLKLAKSAAARKMLVKLGVISAPLKPTKIDPNPRNFVTILNSFCLKESNQTPVFQHRMVPGPKKNIIEMTCTYRDYSTKVRRNTLKHSQEAAAMEMLEKLGLTVDSSNGLLKDGNLTSPSSLQELRLECLKLRESCFVAKNDNEIKRCLQEIYKQKSICCHQSFQKLATDKWKTVNRLQNGAKLDLAFEGFGETIELSSADANKNTLEKIVSANYAKSSASTSAFTKPKLTELK